jgi:hypothetical protein
MVNASMLAASCRTGKDTQRNAKRCLRHELAAAVHLVPMRLFAGGEVRGDALPQLVLLCSRRRPAPRVLNRETPSSPLQQHSLDGLIGAKCERILCADKCNRLVPERKSASSRLESGAQTCVVWGTSESKEAGNDVSSGNIALLYSFL